MIEARGNRVSRWSDGGCICRKGFGKASLMRGLFEET